MREKLQKKNFQNYNNKYKLEIKPFFIKKIKCVLYI